MEARHAIEFQEVIEIIKKIIKENGNNLNQLVSNNSLKVVNKYKENIEKLFNTSIHAEKENNGFIMDIREELLKLADEEGYEIDEFVDFYVGYVDSRTEPYKMASFIREMQINEFKKLVDYAFNERFLKVTLKVYEHLSDDKMMTALKILKFIVKLRVMKNFDESKTCQEIQQLFGIQKEFVEYINDCINQNFDVLYRNCMAAYVLSIEEKVSN